MNARASLPLIILAVPVLALALLWSQPPDAYAGGPTINVDETADELNVDGDCSLREAIKATRENAAVDACPAGHPAGPDQIVLESGVTYNLSIEGDGNDEGDLDVGGAASSPLTIRSEPGPANAVIDAGGIDRVIDIGGNDLTIDGITITGGNATTPGGGILNNGTLTLENSTVIDNQSTKYGGGIANQFDDSLTISDSVIAENSAGQEGGGISSIGPFVMTDSIVRDNTSQGNGGGLQLSEGGLITRSTVSGNTSAGFGGGIDNFSADLIVERSLISGNSAQWKRRSA
jgi:CSLREA domain-containing protein